MDTNTILLVVAALVPAVALCIFIFIKDRVEKEPIGLLLLLFALGAIICFPAASIEVGLSEVIDNVFANFAYVNNGELQMSTSAYTAYLVTSNFIGIALIEEGLKFLVMFLVTRKNKNFNSLFDGLVYAVFVSLGFAALENVFYVIELGWEVAALRAVTAVPGHMFFAVMMGYYYSTWHMSEKAKTIERELKKIGLIPQNAVEFSGGKYLFLSLFVPVCIHGAYDYCCNYGTLLSTIALLVFMIILYVYCFRKILQLSKADADDATFSSAMIYLKYPHLMEMIKARVAQGDPSNPPANTYNTY